MAPDWATDSPISAPPAHLLRPLTTGEILDSTFTLYRSRFWLFAGLASLAGAWSVVIQGLQLLLRHLTLIHYGQRAVSAETSGASGISAIIMLPVTAVVHAAAVYALSEIYLGRPISAAQALAATRSKWLRYVGISLWQGWAAAWVFLLLFIPALILIIVLAARSTGGVALGALLMFLAVFGGGTYGVIAYIRNSLAVPSAVVEGSGVRASMRRSKDLAAGTKGRIFLVLLVAFALYMVAGVLDTPLLILIARSPAQEHILAQGVMLLVGFIAQTVVAPVVIIGLTLVYFDQRVRNEAFDLLMLLGPTDPIPAVPEPIIPEPGPLPTEPPPFYADPSPAPVVPEPIEYAEAQLDPADPIGDDGRV